MASRPLTDEAADPGRSGRTPRAPCAHPETHLPTDRQPTDSRRTLATTRSGNLTSGAVSRIEDTYDNVIAEVLNSLFTGRRDIRPGQSEQARGGEARVPLLRTRIPT